MAVSNRRRPHRESRRAFTLVELIVVIGIIALLLGLTVSASVAVVEKSREGRTRTTLRLLDMATQEWELAADRKLSWWHKDDPTDPTDYDVHWNTNDIMIISEILPIVERCPASQQVLARIEPDLVHTYEPGQYPEWVGEDPLLRADVDGKFAGRITVLDAWGTPIYATHPGRTATPQDSGHVDADGTVRTINEYIYGVTRNRRVTYVSAGSDRDFGHLFAEDGALYEATLDNLYSAPVWGPYVVVDGVPGGGYGSE